LALVATKDKSLDHEADREKKLVRMATPVEFYCFRCQSSKRSRLRAEWHTSRGVRTICNGCYGELVSLEKRQSKMSQPTRNF